MATSNTFKSSYFFVFIATLFLWACDPDMSTDVTDMSTDVINCEETSRMEDLRITSIQRLNPQLDLDQDSIPDIEFPGLHSVGSTGASISISMAALDGWEIAVTTVSDTLVIDTTFIDTFLNQSRVEIALYNAENHENWDSIRTRNIPFVASDKNAVKCSELDFGDGVSIASVSQLNNFFGRHDKTRVGSPLFDEGLFVFSNGEACYAVEAVYMELLLLELGTQYRVCE